MPSQLIDIIEYGFADENDLCSVLEVDDSELDELLSTSESLTHKQFKKIVSKLVSFLKAERKNYERLYYRDQKSQIVTKK